jgi:hypothetical protein
LHDGGFLVLGTTGSFVHEEIDIILTRFNTSGEKLWTKIFGKEGKDTGYAIIRSKKGELFIVGESDSWTEGDSDLCLTKLDEDGNVIFTQTYGGGRDDRGHAIVQLSNGDIIMTGTTRSQGDGSDEMWLLRTDENGNELWNHTYGWFGTEIGYGLTESPDGNLWMVGTTNSLDTNQQLLLLKTSGHGEEPKFFTYPETNCTVGYAISTIQGKGKVIAGSAFDEMTGSHDFCILRIDGEGKLLWYKTIDIGGDETAYRVRENRGSDIVFIGNTTSRASTRMVMMEVDDHGNEKWRRIYPGPNGYGTGFGLTQTGDRGWGIVGSILSEFGDHDLWFLRTDAMGIAPINTEEVQEETQPLAR